MNALHLATKYRWNGIEQIQTLLDHGLSITDTTFSGQTPLHTAIEFGNDAVSNYLISKDSSLVHITDYRGRTPLHIAAGKGLYNICVSLLQAAAVPVCVDSQNQTPLHYAAKIGKVNICRLLAPMYGRRNIELHDANGNTALLLAASTNKEDCMRVLIEEFYANCSASDNNGHTVMDSVTRLMNSATIKWTLDHEIWGNHNPSPHCTLFDVPSEHEEWNRIASEQRKQFVASYNSLLVHYH